MPWIGRRPYPRSHPRQWRVEFRREYSGVLCIRIIHCANAKAARRCQRRLREWAGIYGEVKS